MADDTIRTDDTAGSKANVQDALEKPVASTAAAGDSANAQLANALKLLSSGMQVRLLGVFACLRHR